MWLLVIVLDSICSVRCDKVVRPFWNLETAITMNLDQAFDIVEAGIPHPDRISAEKFLIAHMGQECFDNFYSLVQPEQYDDEIEWEKEFAEVHGDPFTRAPVIRNQKYATQTIINLVREFVSVRQPVSSKKVAIHAGITVKFASSLLSRYPEFTHVDGKWSINEE